LFSCQEAEGVFPGVVKVAHDPSLTDGWGHDPAFQPTFGRHVVVLHSIPISWQ